MQIGWCWSIFPLFFLTLVALPPSSYHQSSHLDDLRISLVKDNDLVPSCWEGHFSLRKRLDLVPHYIYTTFVRYAPQCWRTAHPKRSARVHPPYTRPQVMHAPDNGSRSSFLFLAFPGLSSARGRKLTEMMICGTFPSSAMTFNRSTVSELPTTSSRRIGRYFSTLPVSSFR